MASDANPVSGFTLPIPIDSADLQGVGVVGVGSLYAVEQGGATIADGNVAAVTSIAVASGAKGIAVSRVGMDRYGRDIVEQLRGRGVDVQAIQTDSDLVTPRWIQRGNTVRVEPYAAFDNIQWDADVEALARSAEVIITDACGRRHGQSRSSIDRMMIAATTAIRIIDLTRRPPSDPPRLDREHVGQTMELCDGFVVDSVALRSLVPAAADAVDGAKRLFELRRCGSVTIVPTERDEGCVVTTRGIERTPRCRTDGTRVALAIGLATVLGRPPHEVVARLTNAG